MADVRRSRDTALGRCRKHPWHQQSPGVCSLCLGECLSRLSSSSSSGKKPSYQRPPESSSSVSTYYSSSLDSSYCPTPSRRQRLGRLADEAKSGPLLLSGLFGGVKDGNLKKSRSMAADTVPRFAGAEGKDEKVVRKKSGGFWSKLVNRRKKRRERDNNGLKRSGTTVREKYEVTFQVLGIEHSWKR